MEASKMRDVYEDALVTLSVTSSPGVTSGIFHPSSSFDFKLSYGDIYGRIACTPTHEELFSALTEGYHRGQDIELTHKQYPSLARGWILQERALATRILHCAHDELVWECRTMHQCQCSMRYRRANDMRGNPFIKFKRFDWTGDHLSDPSEVLDLWALMIQAYSFRHFTKDSDKLAAFSGVAKKFQLAGLGDYHAGIWGRFLRFLLCWYRVPGYAVEKSARIGEPTWSWVSINQEIFHLPFFYEPLPELRPGFEIFEVSTTLDGPDPTGSVSSGKIVGRTLVLEGTLVLLSPYESETWLDTRVDVDGEVFLIKSDICQWETGSTRWQNTQPEERLEAGEKVLCAEVCLTDYLNSWLVLRWSSALQVYRRVGLAHFGADNEYRANNKKLSPRLRSKATIRTITIN
jgi:hypothetical protein